VLQKLTESLHRLDRQKGWMEAPLETRLIKFLQEELAISDSAIATVKRHQEFDVTLLPMILWQYGLVTLEELDRIFDWLETA